MLTTKQEKMLSTFKAFLENTPKELLQEKIEKIAEMNFSGSSVDDYFTNFSKGFLIEEEIFLTSVSEQWEQGSSFQPTENITFDSEQFFEEVALGEFNSYVIAA